jgi:hypothetical protein
MRHMIRWRLERKTYAGPGLAIVDAYVFGSFIVNVGSFSPSSGWVPLSPDIVNELGFVW